MRLHRFYINQKIGQEKEITLTDSELINQLGNVFRFKSGDQVIMFDGSGSEYTAEIVSLGKKEVTVKIIEEKPFPVDVSQKVDVSLYLAIIKKSNFELAAEKCTEIGVSEIHPIISQRSEKKDLNIERLEKIVKEASEQSGRVTLPKVLSITDLDIAVSQALDAKKVCIVFHTAEGLKSMAENKVIMDNKSRAIFIGPEGGFTTKELALFKKNNFQICSLGQNILRAETAAMMAVWEGLK